MYLTRPGHGWGAIFVAVILLSGPESLFALPPRVIAEGELLIIDRPGTSGSGAAAAASDDGAAASSATVPDDIRRFLPQKDLPPLLVHPNYYSKDLEFQAQSIPRGRYLLVTNHPRCRRKCTAEVVLPDGAPVIVHRKSSITYVYPSERVVIDFAIFAHRPPKVHYRRGQGTFRALHEHVGNKAKATREFLVSLPIAGALSSNGRKVRDTGKGALATAGQAGATWFNTVGKLVDGIPGVKTLEGLGQQLPERAHQEDIKRAGERAFRNTPEFVPTVR